MKITVRHLVLATAWALSMAGTNARAEVIHGCYLEKTGALRILVGANKQCSNARSIGIKKDLREQDRPADNNPLVGPSLRLPTFSL